MTRLRKLWGALLASAVVLPALAFMAAPASATHLACGSVITANTTLDSDVGPCPGYGLIVAANKITLDLNGHTVSGANGPGGHAGIFVPLVSNVTVKNGTVQGFDAGVLVLGDGAGKGGRNTVTGITAQDNVAVGTCDLGEGIAVQNSSSNKIVGNKALRNGPYGGISMVQNADRNQVTGNLAQDNDIGVSSCGANSAQGIRIEGPGADHTLVENNRVSGSELAGIGVHPNVCQPGGFPMNEPNLYQVIRRNTVENNNMDGIALMQIVTAADLCVSHGNTIERNVVTGNGFDGIYVAPGGHDNAINSNVANNNGMAGVRLDDPAYRNVFINRGPTLFDLTSPDRAPYVEGTDYRVMSGSGSGDVTARVVAIDIALNPAATSASNPNPVDTSTSGCQQSDYDAAGFQAGDIALIQRGTCTFVSKVNLAIANGASAVVMFNEGQAPNRTTHQFGSVGPVGIPVLSASYATGYELYNLTLAGTVTAHIITNTEYERQLIVPAPYDNTLRENWGKGNGEVDGYDGNIGGCDNNKWYASQFGTVNQPCVAGPGGSGSATGRTGDRPGKANDAAADRNGIHRNMPPDNVQ